MTSPKDSEDFIVTARDVVAAGFCIDPGMKDFLTSRGHCWRAFIREGLPASTLLAFNHAHSDRAVAKARERLNG